MNAPGPVFVPLARLLHWTMAVLVLAMLFIGAGIVSTVSDEHSLLLALHRPLGIAILLLAVLRLAVRLRHPPPPLPRDMPAWQRWTARASHRLLYGAMIAMPLVGWAMLSARGDPVVLAGALHLPPIMPRGAISAALLREAHAWLAYGFLLLILLHVAAALYHGLLRHDGVLASMTGWRAGIARGSARDTGEEAATKQAAGRETTSGRGSPPCR